MLFRTANAPIVGIYQSSGKFIKCASKNADISNEEEHVIKQSINLISPHVLNAVAKVYNLSDSIDDYAFPVYRSVTANIPNSNADYFSSDELQRFSSNHKCQVYQTFNRAPFHVEHASEDPKSARGYIADSYYINSNKDDQHVLCLVGLDTTKDPPLAESIISGENPGSSMGCLCEAVRCSYCNKTAKSDSDLCDHLLFYKMATLDGILVCEHCIGVEFQELSSVGDPADETALTQYILQRAARREEINNVKEQFNILSHLVPKEDQMEVARYFSSNINRLPEAMLRLANKIL